MGLCWRKEANVKHAEYDADMFHYASTSHVLLTLWSVLTVSAWCELRAMEVIGQQKDEEHSEKQSLSTSDPSSNHSLLSIRTLQPWNIPEHCMVSVLIDWHHAVICLSVCPSVCLSVCLSMMLCIVLGLRVSVEGWWLYHHASRRTLPIHFFRHFCCMMYD